MCSLCFENKFLTDGGFRFASKLIFFLSKVFTLLSKLFSFYIMCSLRFENNLLTVGRVRFAFKINFFLLYVFDSLRKYFLFNRMCSLRFENNLLTIEGVCFASILKKMHLLKLSFAFVLISLPLLSMISTYHCFFVFRPYIFLPVPSYLMIL
jgi:hypothetical protein